MKHDVDHPEGLCITTSVLVEMSYVSASEYFTDN